MEIVKNLSEYGFGTLLPRLEEMQDRLIKAVRETGKPGTITLKLTFKPQGIKEVKVDTSLTPSIPEKTIDPVSMFIVDDNKLSPNDPDQVTIDNVININEKEKNGTEKD